MSGFSKIEKAMNEARLQYSDARYDVCIAKAETHESIGYTSTACAVYDNDLSDRALFIHVSKWNMVLNRSNSKYRVQIIDRNGECTYEMDTAGDVATAVTMLIRTATL